MKFIETIQKYWWLLVVCGGGLLGFLVVWSSIPTRLSSAEEKLDDLRVWASEIQGYTRAQQEWNHQQRQAPPRPWTFLREEGDWQVFRDPDGIEQCCDGHSCHPWVPKRKCRR